MGGKSLKLNVRLNKVHIFTQGSKNKIHNAHSFDFNLCKYYLDMVFSKVMTITENYSKKSLEWILTKITCFKNSVVILLPEYLPWKFQKGSEYQCLLSLLFFPGKTEIRYYTGMLVSLPSLHLHHCEDSSIIWIICQSKWSRIDSNLHTCYIGFFDFQ